jgi:hypothetical protein
MKDIVVKMEFDPKKYNSFKKMVNKAVNESTRLVRGFLKKGLFLVNEKRELSMEDLGAIPRAMYDSIIKTKNSYKNLDSLRMTFDSVDDILVFNLNPTKEWNEKNLKSPYNFIIKSLTNLDVTTLSQIFQKVAREYELEE